MLNILHFKSSALYAETLLLSPLEQFEILSLFTFLGFNLTNQFYFLFLLVSTFCGAFYFFILHPETKTLYIITNRWQLVLESIYLLILTDVIIINLNLNLF